MPNPANPWQNNAFDWANTTPGYHHPGIFHAPRRHPARVPESDILFDIQRDLLKVIRMQDELEAILLKHKIHYSKWNELQRQTTNAYKLINRYLKMYVTQEGANAFV